MRALCGAIITAGALIGLGLTAFGIGTRYNGLRMQDSQGNLLHRDKTGDIVEAGSNNSIGVMGMKFSEMDRGLTTVLIVLLIVVVIGLATTFIGLMYHHYRRHHEMLRNHHTQAQAAHSSV